MLRQKTRNNFSDKALEFYEGLSAPKLSQKDVSCLNPYQTESSRHYIRQFLEKYYNDNAERVLIFGINPGRLGGGSTGVSFTDPVALEDFCGIPNTLPKRRELSSEFVYNFAFRWGGPEKLFERFFFTALCPLGFVKAGKNFNFYDSTQVAAELRDFMVTSIKAQLSFGGSRKTAIVLGAGKNAAAFKELNRQFNLFDKYFVLEHPRFIMQYKRRALNEYLEKYHSTFKAALN